MFSVVWTGWEISLTSGFIVTLREVEQRGHCFRAAEMGNMYLNIY